MHPRPQTRFAVDFDRSPVGAHDPIDDSKPEAANGRPSVLRKKRFEDTGTRRIIHPASVVLNCHPDRLGMLACREAPCGRLRCADTDCAALR